MHPSIDFVSCSKLRKYGLLQGLMIVLVSINFASLTFIDIGTETSTDTPYRHENLAARRDISKVVIDTAEEYPKPLINAFLMGSYKNLASSFHDMDAVVMATAPDSTIAISIHNLYHFCGFRRFIFFVNERSRCHELFDLIPQHHSDEKKNLCFEHEDFYDDHELEQIHNRYPMITKGDLRMRGGKSVYVSRMGWYLQQFSKLLVKELVPDLSSRYLAIDGDVIFTRPFKFLMTQPDGSVKIPLPSTKKPVRSWQRVAKLVLEGVNTTDFQTNYVIGWMVMDKAIVSSLLNTFSATIKNSTFPLSVLELGESLIGNNMFFSEFYIYAHFALNQYQSPYVSVRGNREERNNGLERTCILSKDLYRKTQENSRLGATMIWEEHKYHSLGGCPEQDKNTLSNIGFWHDLHPPPWGGGNQFLLALRSGLETSGLNVVFKNDPKAMEFMRSNTQVFLANSITFGGKNRLLKAKRSNNLLALVHRVDGPYYVARYMRSLNITDSTVLNIPEEDRLTENINREFACATVFQSRWSMNANIMIGLNLRNPVLIPNTVDPLLFSPPKGSSTKVFNGRLIKIIASSHSVNERKGFDTMSWIDKNLNFSKFEFMYIGGIPDEFQPKNIRIIAEGASENVSNVLRSGDIYFAPSRAEPASNAVLEALACGLPVVYQQGSSHGELVGGGGVGFSAPGPQLLSALDEVVENYSEFAANITIPLLSEVAKKYLSVMHWCYYMRHVL